jgi:hypothetical protein
MHNWLTIQPMAYDVFIRRAERRMLGLRDKLRDAPFLQGQGIDGVPSGQTTLFQSEMDLSTAQGATGM